MTGDSISLSISTPSEPIAPGRGFYQLEEEALFVQVGQFVSRRRFFSYLDSERIRLDFDRLGRLIFIEIDISRRLWQVSPALTPPEIVEPADIRWLHFRESVPIPRLLTNERKTVLKLAFRQVDQPLNYYAAQSVIAQVDHNSRLAALWITDITDDIAGQEIGAFRKGIRAYESYYNV